MPPENEPVTSETPTPPPSLQGNSPEARNPDGSLKTPEAAPPSPSGETKSTPPSQETKKSESESKPSLLNQKDAEASIATGAPEKYEFKDLPEGVEVTEKALAFFKENQMSQAQADRAVKFYNELAREAAQAPFKHWEDMNNDWVKTVTADPEYKGNMTELKSTISKFIDQVGDATLGRELREAMDLTGAGNNPAFVKFMFRMGQMFNEGKHVAAGGPSVHGQSPTGRTERPNAAHSLYPTLP